VGREEEGIRWGGEGKGEEGRGGKYGRREGEVVPQCKRRVDATDRQ